jgi:hypothetical protein
MDRFVIKVVPMLNPDGGQSMVLVQSDADREVTQICFLGPMERLQSLIVCEVKQW